MQVQFERQAMILKELLRATGEVLTANQDSRICDVAAIMNEKHIGSIVVIDNERLVIGMITDRDIAMALALGSATADSFINEVMSKSIETVPENATLFDVARFFRTVSVKRLPVVDQSNRLVGIVSSDDVVTILAREMFDTCKSFESKLGHLV